MSNSWIYVGRGSGNTTIDYFSYSAFNGNQLKYVYDDAGSYGLYNTKEYNDRVTDQTIEFTYDPNGNMISDLDREIVTIRYNILNLPDTIQFKKGHQIINKYFHYT